MDTTTLALIEVTASVFVAISYLGQNIAQDNTKCVKWLKLSLVATFFSLTIDAMSYIFSTVEYPFVFRYYINLLAYTICGFIIVFFTKYCETYISSKIKINPWLFRVPVILTLISIIATAAEFIAGNIIVFENQLIVETRDVPVYIRVIQLAVMFYMPAVAFAKRKSIGRKALFLLGFYNIAPMIALVSTYFTGTELTVVFAAVAIIMVASLLQKDMTNKWIEDNTVKELRAEELDKIRKEQIAKLSGADTLYIVDLTNDTFQVVFQDEHHSEKYHPDKKYDETLSDYVAMDVFEPDREMVLNELSIKALSEHIEHEKDYRLHFRDVSYGRPLWYELRAMKLSDSEIIFSFTNKNKEIILGNFQDKLNNEFFALFSVNLDNDQITVLKNQGLYPTEKIGDSIEFSSSIKKYADTQCTETREVLYRLADIENLRKKLVSEDKLSYSYRSPIGNGTKWVTISTYVISRHSDGVPAELILGFSLLDMLSADGHELREKLKEINHIIGALSEDYICVDYIELEDSDASRSIEYRSSDFLKKYIPEWNEERDYLKRIQLISKYLVYEPDREQFLKETGKEAVLKKFEKDESCFINFRIVVDDEIMYYQFHLSPVKDKDKVVGFVIGLHSVDEQIKKEKEYQEELQHALETAQFASKAKTDFLFNMSHDIRTPMNAIIGFTNMALKHIDDNERVEDSLLKTQQAGELLLSLINDILDMSRIESGKVQFDENEADIYHSFTNIESTLQEMAKNKDLDLKFEFGEIEDRYVYADKSLCIRVFVNIITNAIKYTENGGYIKVRCEQTGKKDVIGEYRYTFEDNGIGMSEEFCRHAFEAFARENTATVSGIQGTGLGLAVCRSFVNTMKGTIDCRSKQGEGSTFIVTLPFKIREAVSECQSTEEKAQKEMIKVDLTGKKVLLVEDNELNREIIESILSEEGLQVRTASDGSVAVKIMKETGISDFDFILMDIQMPIMNGYEATRMIRKMYPDSNIPIIALSANAFEEDKVASLSAGMNDHVAKPVDLDELRSVLGKVV